MLNRGIVPVIFSGYNNRAVVSLCRFFFQAGQKFHLIAAHDDAILRTEWRKHVLFRRRNSELNLSLIQNIYSLVAEKHEIPALCSTSEFLNTFVLKNSEQMKSSGWGWLLPNRSVYEDLTNKLTSKEMMKALIGLKSPSTLAMNDLTFPLVLKPKKNFQDGKICYPIICQTDDDFLLALGGINSNEWFAQEWLDGQSLYLCAYLDRSGGWSAYWQENLCQQPNGKSIVFARTCSNPGINVDLLMSELHIKGFHGPFMMEVIRDLTGELFFIEVNPRFWGPLELGRKAFPQLLGRFLADLRCEPQVASAEYSPQEEIFYAWAYGARKPFLRSYPSFSSIQMPGCLDDWLESNDIYNMPDTINLFNSY